MEGDFSARRGNQAVFFLLIKTDRDYGMEEDFSARRGNQAVFFFIAKKDGRAARSLN